MSEQELTPDELVFLHYAVLDKKNLYIAMDSLKDARKCAKAWNNDSIDDGPHRVVEVLAREVKP